ncbi:integrator complex subunit 1 [Anopheles darlingi]|uniref:integrator complex subunit 1 n=1 Tax=Anopheles darlingi TaxID=43151 RepID=UPI0021002678|nr:integrator complex subunit 1 [Anopheles darlingi]
MDRGKTGTGLRGTKKQQLSHPQSELYALGSKAAGGSRDDGKTRTLVGGVSDRKREASSSVLATSPVVAKKIKLSSGSGSSLVGGSSGLVVGGTSKSSSGGDSSSSSSVLEYWEQCAMDCESVDLAATVLSAIEQQDSDSVVGYICGAIKLLISPKSKSESVLSLSLLYLARLRPHLFCNETITTALIAVLKRDGGGNAFKGRNNPTMHILACNLLARGYTDKKQWPESFIRAYIDDAINDRVWVDYEECAPFTDNIVAAFGTKIPPKWMLQPELTTLNPTSRENSLLDDEHSTDSSGLFGDALGRDPDANPPRFAHIREQIERMVMDAIKDQLNRRQGPECSTKNFLRFLSLTCGILEVRAFVVPRLEMWIHNGKLVKPVQELLTFLCYNVTGQNAKEHEVLSNLAKVRLKSKPLINIFMIGLKEMINCQPDILTPLLKYVVQNELSNAHNPNNMGMLAMMFQTKPTESAAHLAEIYQEFLVQREDVLRTLRFFLRELVKMLRYDINLPVFCKVLLQHRPDLSPPTPPNGASGSSAGGTGGGSGPSGSEFRDRIFHSIVDLVCLCMFLCVSPQIREANVSIRSGRESKSSPALSAFYQQQSMIQDQALTWMKDVVPRMFKPITAAEYKAALQKLLLLDSPETYAKGDQWPPEAERGPLLRMVSEIPLQQNVMLCLLLIGIEKEIPFSIQDTMDITEQLVRRAGSLRHIDYPPLEITDLKIIELLFKMSEYHHPDNIVLPANYEPPNLAISSLYWKTWIILLLISAHNPSTFGSFCWDQYPMLRLLMEMCITNQIAPPKPTDEELAVAALEKHHILEFENHLASNPITEQNSLLLSQLILMDPRGVARRPPNPVLDQIQQLNVSHRLGHLLCRSRKPDLLLEIIQRQGTSQSMPWLADLVQNSEGDFNHLPVQCLCEFLLANAGMIIVEASREAELLQYLQRVLQDETGEHQMMVGEILEYFLRRLSSFSSASRQSAIRGLKLLLKVFQEEHDPGAPPIETNQSGDWLLRYLPMIPPFPYVRANVIVQLRAACHVENIPELVMVYIQFVAAHTAHDGEEAMLEHVMDMSHLIVERTTVFASIIPTVTDQAEARIQTLNCLFVMFNNFLIKLRDAKSIPQSFTEYSDLLLVQFADESQCHIHLNIIQAFVILLTHSSFISVAGQILDYWFPEGAPPPQAFTIDTAEPVQILPDWLKLKMIRSNVERLVDAALQGLTPDQIVLFVQNFGTPVASMSKLLAVLDRAVIEQYEAVNAAILNKCYLAQLIEIQQARGAKYGHISVDSLGLQAALREASGEHKPDEPMATETAEPETVPAGVMEPYRIELLSGTPPVPPRRSVSSDTKPAPGVSSSKTKEIEEAVELVLTGTLKQSGAPAMAKYRKLIQRLLNSAGGSSRSRHPKAQEYAANKTVAYLGRIMKSPQGQGLIKALVQNAQTVCFFRALLETPPEKFENLNYLLHVLGEIIRFMNPISNTVLLEVLVSKRQQLIKIAQKDASNGTAGGGQVHPGTASQHPVSEAAVVDGGLLEVLTTSKAGDVERRGMLQLQRTSREELISVASTLLKDKGVVKQEPEPSTSTIGEKMEIDGSGTPMLVTDGSVDQHQCGLLVDWVADADSELIRIDKRLQMELLFSRSLSNSRPYLLSLMSHQASWATLHQTIGLLLDSFDASFDPSSVLDFVDTLTRNPRLWQGRDKAVPKHEQIEYILSLSEQQTCTFIDYILAEDAVDRTTTMTTHGGSVRRLGQRVRLLLHCLPTKYKLLPKMVAYVERQLAEPGERGRMGRQFLQQLYLHLPTMKFLLPNVGRSINGSVSATPGTGESVYEANVQNVTGGCLADRFTYYILTTIASLNNPRDFQTMSAEMELIARKLAASHPTLLLRQLPVLAALLQGRAHMDLHVLRSEYHFHLFHQVMGILELLAPLVFRDCYRDGLHNALDCFCQLLRHHGTFKESYTLIYRFVEFLQSYIATNPPTAVAFVEQYADVLCELSSQHYDLHSLQQLVQGLSMLKPRSGGESATKSDIMADLDILARSAPAIGDGSTIASTSTDRQLVPKANGSSGAAATATGLMLAPYIKNESLPMHWTELVGVLRSRDCDEIGVPLMELDALSIKRPTLLEDIFDDVVRFVQHPSPNIRQLAHNLIVRWLKQSPGCKASNETALTAFVQCLNHDALNVAYSALDKTTEYTLCLQEYAPQILTAVFNLGIGGCRINTYNALRRCVQALKKQHAG